MMELYRRKVMSKSESISRLRIVLMDASAGSKTALADILNAFAGSFLGASSPIVGSPEESIGMGRANATRGPVAIAHDMSRKPSAGPINERCLIDLIYSPTSVPAKDLVGGDQVPLPGSFRICGRVGSGIAQNWGYLSDSGGRTTHRNLKARCGQSESQPLPLLKWLRNNVADVRSISEIEPICKQLPRCQMASAGRISIITPTLRLVDRLAVCA